MEKNVGKQLLAGPNRREKVADSEKRRNASLALFIKRKQVP